MKIGFTNKVISSTVLWLRDLIERKGLGYTNVSTKFYPSSTIYNNYQTYTSPYKSIISNHSVNANVMTGVYLNNVFITTGISGFKQINYEEGHLYFTGLNTNAVISGDYSFPDFNVKTTHKSESELLFETKFHSNPKTSQTLSGLPPDAITIPCVFVKNNFQENVPGAFGGSDWTKNSIKLIILSDTEWKLDALSSILTDHVRTYIPILNQNEYPYNVYGGYKSGNYNYVNLTQNKINEDSAIFIENINISKVNIKSSVINNLNEINPEIRSMIVHIETSKLRNPRQDY